MEKCSQKTTYTSKGPEVTLRDIWGHKNSDVSSMPRETDRKIADVELRPNSIRESQLAGRWLTRTSSTCKELKISSMMLSWTISTISLPKSSSERSTRSRSESTNYIEKKQFRDDLREAHMADIDLTKLERVHTKASSKIRRSWRSVSQRRMPRETEKPPRTMIDEKPTDGTSTSKKDQDRHGMMNSENFERVPNPDDELNMFFCQGGHGVMNVDIFSTDFFLSACSSNNSVYDGRCIYTHLSHAHFSAHSTLAAYFTHLHACHIHAWLKCP